MEKTEIDEFWVEADAALTLKEIWAENEQKGPFLAEFANRYIQTYKRLGIPPGTIAWMKNQNEDGDYEIFKICENVAGNVVRSFPANTLEHLWRAWEKGIALAGGIHHFGEQILFEWLRQHLKPPTERPEKVPEAKLLTGAEAIIFWEDSLREALNSGNDFLFACPGCAGVWPELIREIGPATAKAIYDAEIESWKSKVYAKLGVRQKDDELNEAFIDRIKLKFTRDEVPSVQVPFRKKLFEMYEQRKRNREAIEHG